MSDDARRSRSLAPREALDRYLSSRRPELTEASLSSYYYRLKLFVEWCEGQRIEDVDELDGWLLDSYETARRGVDPRPTTLNNEMKTLRRFISYLERLEIVEEGLSEKVHVPDVPDDEKSDEEMLAPVDALELIRHYRNDPSGFAGRDHVLIELAWHTGARLGGLRALDVRDFHVDENFVLFEHRPETGTPLKNGRDGERPVGIPPGVSEILRRHLEYKRPDVHDEHGRQPLIASYRGRPGTNAIRVWSYLATQPCIYGPCPHGRDPETCLYRERSHASKCPSSRSPHKIRTGSITWQRNLGFPPEVVSERVNATLDVIEDYYDKETAIDRLEQRRRPFLERMEIDEEESET